MGSRIINLSNSTAFFCSPWIRYTWEWVVTGSVVWTCPIAREPGTNLPKLPGTSLNGAIRYYAALSYGGDKIKCAGQGDEKKKEATAVNRIAPSVIPLAALQAKKGRKKGLWPRPQGFLMPVFLLFPVHSVAGPVWVTSPETLRDFGLVVGKTPKFEKVEWKYL